MKKILTLTLIFAMFAELKAPKQVRWTDGQTNDSVDCRQPGPNLVSQEHFALVDNDELRARGAAYAYQGRRRQHPELGGFSQLDDEYYNPPAPLAQQLVREQTGEAVAPSTSVFGSVGSSFFATEHRGELVGQEFDWQSIQTLDGFTHTRAPESSEALAPKETELKFDPSGPQDPDALVQKTLEDECLLVAQEVAWIVRACAVDGFLDDEIENDEEKVYKIIRYEPKPDGPDFIIKVYSVEQQKVTDKFECNEKGLRRFVKAQGLSFNPADFPDDFSTGRIGKIHSKKYLIPPTHGSRFRSYGPEPTFPLD